MNLKKIFFLLLSLIVIITPLFRIKFIMNQQGGDFSRHVFKIKQIYFNETYPSNEKNQLTEYPTNFHSLLWNLSGKNFDNILFTYSFLLCIFLIFFRIAIFLLLSRHFSDQTSFLILFLYFELPYILPGLVSYYLNRVLFEFPPGFWSFELLTIHSGLLPSLISTVFSLFSLLFPLTTLFSLIISLTLSNFSGFATFMTILFLSIIENKYYSKKIIPLFLLLIVVFFKRIKKMIFYVFSHGFKVRDDRFITFLILIIFLFLIINKKKKTP